MTSERDEATTATMQAADAYQRLRIEGAANDLIALHAALADSVEFGRWLASAGFDVGGALAARADAIEAKTAEALGAYVNGLLGVIAPTLEGAGFEAHAAAAMLAAGAIPELSDEARRYVAKGVYSRLRAGAERAGAAVH